MKFTSNYKLKRLEDGDPIDILEIGENMDILDRELKKKAETSGGDISKMTVKTLKANTAEFPIPEAGEDAETFLGKVKKFFEDTKNWMTGVCMLGQLVNNCVTNRSDLPLAAAQGKVLMDLYTQLNSDIPDLQNGPVFDVENHQTVTLPFTATTNGFLFASAAGRSGIDGYLYLDSSYLGGVVAHIEVFTSISQSKWIPVAKGDIISISKYANLAGYSFSWLPFK